MIPIEYEIDRLRGIVLEMMELVKNQLNKSKDVILSGDTDLAEEVVRKELRVNAYEISIDTECENLLAMYSPVATDLRFVISSLKISGNLERIGDHAYRLSKMVLDHCIKFNKENLKELDIEVLFTEADSMLENAIKAFEEKDVKIAKKVFKQDKTINKINKNSADSVIGKISKDIKSASEMLILYRSVGKLERVGDLIKNICEEIIFYIEADILKHRKRNKKIKKQISE